MYEEIRPTVSIFSMSNNSETMFLAKNDDQFEESTSKFNILKRPSLEFQDQSHVQAEFRIMNIAAASVPDPININEVVQVQEEEEEEEEEGKHCFADEIRQSSTLGEIKVTNEDEDDDDDDGFRTPTSLDHKIPVMTQCPPAPRKPKQLRPLISIISSPSRKRKLSFRRVVDFTKEVESLFLPRRDDVFATITRIIKKSRSDVDVTDHNN